MGTYLHEHVWLGGGKEERAHVKGTRERDSARICRGMCGRVFDYILKWLINV